MQAGRGASSRGASCGRSTARADIRRVTGGSQRLSLAAELAAARQILASAGIEVTAGTGAELPELADAVLAPVLREAVTNILRHSAATRCTIEATDENGTLQLRVSNDGAVESPQASDGTALAATGGHRAMPAARDGGGSGLANLTARVQSAGGRLTTSNAGGRFDLIAEIPLPSPPAVSPAAPAAPNPGPARQSGVDKPARNATGFVPRPAARQRARTTCCGATTRSHDQGSSRELIVRDESDRKS